MHKTKACHARTQAAQPAPRGCAARAQFRPRGYILAAIFSRESVKKTFLRLPLAVSMPPTKVCLQCKAAVHIKRKVCERCDHVFPSKRKAEFITSPEKAMKRIRALESDSVKAVRKAKDKLQKGQ